MRGRRPEPRHHPGYSSGRTRIPHHILHANLWAKANDRRRVKLHIGQWAEEIGIDYETTHYLVGVLVQERRIRRVAVGNHQIGTYEIADPATYNRDSPPAERPLRWG
jgi:hypothetical protein